jgi:hypothetical protein
MKILSLTAKSRKRLVIFVIIPLIAVITFVCIVAYNRISSKKIGEYGYYDDSPFYKAKALILGQYLNKKFPNQKVLLLRDYYLWNNQRFWDIVLFLGIGLGGVDKIEIDSLRINNSRKKCLDPNGEIVMPIEEIMTAADFDATISAHPDCSIIVSMIGLPYDKKKLKFWNNKNKHLAMMNANIFDLKNFIREERVVAAISFKPGVRFTDDPAPKNLKKAFNERYVLITPENISEMEKKYPKLFK